MPNNLLIVGHTLLNKHLIVWKNSQAKDDNDYHNLFSLFFKEGFISIPYLPGR